MAPAKLRSHLYLRAIRWIADEDKDSRGQLDALPLSRCTTVRLCSHLWNRPALLVAREIIALRGA